MEAYKDLNMLNPTQRPTVSKFDAIYQALLNLITMKPNQIPFSRVGIDLEEDLFEFVDSAGAFDILNKISKAVDEFLPVVKLSFGRSKVEPLPSQNAYRLELIYTLPDITDEEFTITGNLGSDGELT